MRWTVQHGQSEIVSLTVDITFLGPLGFLTPLDSGHLMDIVAKALSSGPRRGQ